MRSYNTFANRGRDFEDFVIQVNDLYTRSGKAVVYKVPTEFLPIRDSTAHRDGLRPDMDAATHGERSPGRFSSGLGSKPRRPHRPALPGNH